MSDKEELREEELEEMEGGVETSSESSFQMGKSLMYTIIAVVLIVAGVGGYFYHKSNVKKESIESTKALTRIIPLYQQNQFDKALMGDNSILIDNKPLMGLVGIADKYKNEVGKQAAVYAANSYMFTNKMNDAEKYFKIAIEAESKLIKVAAYSGLAQCQELQGKFAEAADNYSKAADVSENDNFKVKNMLFAGLCFERANNKDKAVQNFKDVIGTNRVSEYAKIAKGRLALLGIIID